MTNPKKTEDDKIWRCKFCGKPFQYLTDKISHQEECELNEYVKQTTNRINQKIGKREQQIRADERATTTQERRHRLCIVFGIDMPKEYETFGQTCGRAKEHQRKKVLEDIRLKILYIFDQAGISDDEDMVVVLVNKVIDDELKKEAKKK